MRDTSGPKRQLGIDNQGTAENFRVSRTVLPTVQLIDGRRSTYQPIPQHFQLRSTEPGSVGNHATFLLRAPLGSVVYPQWYNTDPKEVLIGLSQGEVLTSPLTVNLSCFYPKEFRPSCSRGQITTVTGLPLMDFTTDSRGPQLFPEGFTVAGDVELEFVNINDGTAMELSLGGYIIQPDKGMDIRGQF